MNNCARLWTCRISVGLARIRASRKIYRTGDAKREMHSFRRVSLSDNCMGKRIDFLSVSYGRYEHSFRVFAVTPDHRG